MKKQGIEAGWGKAWDETAGLEDSPRGVAHHEQGNKNVG